MMKKRILARLLGGSFLLVTLVLAGCSPISQQEQPREETVFRLVNRVKSITDGDSIILESPVIVHGSEVTEVRLLGIDAPEKRPIDNFDYHNQVRHGQRATQFLEYLLPTGTEITLTMDQRNLCGRGRLLATVEKGDLNINKQMLQRGYAAKFVVWTNSHYDGRFEALRGAMMEAKWAERGIWSPSDRLEELPLEYRNRVSGAPLYIGDFTTKKYVPFENMQQIDVENRVYFFRHDAVITAGYVSRQAQP